jgi:hypothetical protein
MTERSAERAITVSALAVAGIYAYRRATETPGPVGGSLGRALFSDFGHSAPAPVASFITAWGFTFLALSVVASVSPGLGGSFAILVAVADALGNASQLSADVNKKVSAGTGADTAALQQAANKGVPALATAQGTR